MPHLFDSTPFASLAMTSVHARRARNAYRTHQDPSAQSTNSAPQHPPIIFYDVSKNHFLTTAIKAKYIYGLIDS